MHAELLIMRLIHIVAGMMWVGTGLFNALFLVPSLTGTPALMGPVMTSLRQRGLFTALPIIALLTIGSGARLMFIISASSPTGYLSTPVGQAFAASGLCAMLAFLSSLLVSRPAFQRAGTLSAKLPSAATDDERASLTARIARLRRISGVASTVATAGLVLAAGGMSVARYVS